MQRFRIKSMQIFVHEAPDAYGAHFIFFTTKSHDIKKNGQNLMGHLRTAVGFDTKQGAQ